MDNMEDFNKKFREQMDTIKSKLVFEWYKFIRKMEMELCCCDTCKICDGNRYPGVRKILATRELHGNVAYWCHNTLMCEASKIRERFYNEKNNDG